MRDVIRWRALQAELVQPGQLPLTQFSGRPEPVLRQCRAVIEATAPEEERGNLLAVTQVLASLRYDDPQLLSILMRRAAMIESPLLRVRSRVES